MYISLGYDSVKAVDEKGGRRRTGREERREAPAL